MRVFHHWVPGRKVALFVAEGTALSAACVGGAVIASRALEPSGVPVSASAWRIVWLRALGGVAGTYGSGTGGLNIAGTNDTANGINTQAAITLATAILFGTANAGNNFTINNYEVYISR
jgi:hypothetical protein